ncbi:MAG: FRG domain-containing protein [Burkholderiales bacterium]|nr:FRG domain-containing protein [Burkholderiales bacterium]
MMIEQIEYGSAEGLLSALMPWAERKKMQGYIFRGVTKSEYPLLPSALRRESFWQKAAAYRPAKPVEELHRLAQYAAEYHLIREFYKLANGCGLPVPLSPTLRQRLSRNYDFVAYQPTADESYWLPNELLEGAALAQHYGIPTRLLDWSYDPFVALYFASQVLDDNEGALALWALHADNVYWEEVITPGIRLKFVTPHYSGNPNIAAQQGVFTHWPMHQVRFNGDVERAIEELGRPIDRRPLDELLFEVYEEKLKGVIKKPILYKMILPAAEAQVLREHLLRLGYGPSRIFPGYSGVAHQVLSVTSRSAASKSNGASED